VKSFFKKITFAGIDDKMPRNEAKWLIVQNLSCLNILALSLFTFVIILIIKIAHYKVKNEFDPALIILLSTVTYCVISVLLTYSKKYFISRVFLGIIPAIVWFIFTLLYGQPINAQIILIICILNPFYFFPQENRTSLIIISLFNVTLFFISIWFLHISDPFIDTQAFPNVNLFLSVQAYIALIYILIGGTLFLIYESEHAQNETETINLKLISFEKKLKKYLPPQLVDVLTQNGNAHQIATERRKLTIFFSDIKGFSNITESIEPEELSSMLNEYLTEMTLISNKWGGTLDKFIGDAIMIFFGAPEESTDKKNAYKCVKMAIEMQGKMEKLKKKWFDSGIEYPLAIRIGINTGVVTVGNFGAEDRLSYTATGGHVNLASRLEALCKPDGILISHPTYTLIKDEIECKLRNKVKVKGIVREILTYEVVID
jgi:class 3 adenylate cyclase